MSVLVGIAILAGTSACGSAGQPAPTTQSIVSAPVLAKPPPELGNGLVCAAAADRLLGIVDGMDIGQFTRGATRPQSATIQQALRQYLTARDKATRTQAAGLIQGQCAAYGFYVTTYQQCVRSSASRSTIDAVRGCIERRRWTVYTQQ